MIRFFRTIRQRLLAENRFTRYMVYAIGEIVLVVIGILLALQVNTWNEQRKASLLENTYLVNLRDDLLIQIHMLEGYIDFEIIIIRQSTAIASHYEANNGFNVMDSIYPKLNDLSVRWTFVNSNTTLIEMMSSGQINLIRNKELKKNLIEFNQQVEAFSKNTQNNNTNLIDNLIVPDIINALPYASLGYSEDMRLKFGDYYLEDLPLLNDVDSKTIADEFLSVPKNRLNMINKVLFRRAMVTMQRTGNENLKRIAEGILNDIERELVGHPEGEFSNSH